MDELTPLAVVEKAVKDRFDSLDINGNVKAYVDSLDLSGLVKDEIAKGMKEIATKPTERVQIFKSMGEQLSNIHAATIGHNAAASEKLKSFVGEGGDGGYLIAPEFSTELIRSMYEESPLASLVTILNTNSTVFKMPLS